MSPETSAARPLTRLILPALLFAGIVGGVAWVTVNLPKGAVNSQPAPAPPAPIDTPRQAALKFERTRAVWDEKDPGYAMECEVGKEGFYDFPFVNVTGQPVIFGLAQTSCDCSKLLVTALGSEIVKTFDDPGKMNKAIFPVDSSWTWTELKRSDKEGIEIPAGGGGVARVQWNGRKSAGSTLNLNIKMWMHPANDPAAKSFEALGVPTKMSEPVRYLPERLTLPVISAGSEEKGEFLAFSPTRDEIDLRVNPEKNDPLLDITVEKIDAAKAKELQAKLVNAAAAKLDDKAAEEYLARTTSQMKSTRVRAAYRIAVKLRESRDGKHLDQGPFSRDLPLMSNDTAVVAPTLAAYVRGEVDVGLPEDNGKVNLKTFSATDGIRKTLPLWADGAADLKIESFAPRVLDVKLKKNEKESTPSRSKWLLDIAVPPSAWSGPFGEEATIIINRTNSTPPRRIRIPVIGNAGG